MDALEVVKTVITLGVTIVGGVVSGLAIRSWNSWKKDKEETEKAINSLNTSHEVLASKVERNKEHLAILEKKHDHLDHRFHEHQQKHVRLSTIVERLDGNREGRRSHGDNLDLGATS